MKDVHLKTLWLALAQVLLFFGLTFGFCSIAYSQITNLKFSSAPLAPAAYTELSGGTSLIPGGSAIGAASAVTPIGFNFVFQGNTFSSFSVNAAGLMRLGSVVVTTESANNASSITNTPKLYAWWDATATMAAANGGGVTFALTGTAPNRVLTVQWRVAYTTSATTGFSYQVKLYETTNVIEYLYGAGPPSGTISASVGLGNFGANEYLSFYTFNNIPSGTLNYNANTIFPGGGVGFKYTFSPSFASLSPANLANKPSFWLRADGAFNATRTLLNVPAGSRTASSELSTTWTAANSVLNGANAWIPSSVQGGSGTPTGSNQIGALTLDLGSVQTIHGVATLGAGNNAFFTKDYMVRVSNDNVTYTDLGLFMGNELNTALRFADFDVPVSCRYVRIIPSGFETWRALRVDVYTKTSAAIPNNTRVSNWEDNSGNQWHAYQNVLASQPNFNTNQINFNPAVNFTNNPGTSLNIPDLANIRQSYWVAQDATAAGNTYFHVLFGNEATTLYGTTATTPNFFGGLAGAVQFTSTMTASQGGWRKDGTVGSAASTYDFGPQGKPNLMTSFSLADNAPFSAQSISFQSGTNRSWQGPISEIITFQNQITANQHNIVETYLGIKYGISIGHDYVTPDGTIVWNRTTNTAYHNNVFGLGRSDSQGLHQRQSFSTSFTGRFITLGNNSVIGATNAASVGNNIAADNSYLLLGDNNAPILYEETLTGDYYPLLRKWKVSNTGITAATKISVPAFGNASPNAVPSSNTDRYESGTFYLALDTDGDGNFSNATYTAMTKVGTGANATWEINQVLPNNAVIGFAVKQNSTDTDGDSVLDVTDIDDDNDGVIDALEQTNCITAGRDLRYVNMSGSVISQKTENTIKTNTTVDGATWISSYSTETYSLPLSLKFKREALTGQAMVGLIPVGNAQTPNAFTDNGYKFYLFGGTVYGYFGTTWNFTHTSQLNEEYSIDISATGFVTVRINGQVLRSFQGANSDYRFVVSSSATAVALKDIRLTNATNPERTFCMDRDTDSDGIPNRLELDSDNDGCSDAVEAGTVTNLTATTVAGPYGANGLANSLETVADNGVYNRTVNYYNARIAAIKGCADADGDSVADLVDLDDDNDGITDAQECPPFDINNLNYAAQTFSVTNGASASQTFPAAPDGLVVNVWTLDNSFNVRINGTHLTNPEELQFWTLAPTDALFEFLDGTAYSAVWTIVGNQAKPLIRVFIDKFGQVKVYGSRTSGGALEEMRLRNGSFNEITLNTNASNTFQIGQAVVAQTFITGDYGVILAPNCDADNDGIPNGLDLDSDGDGCPDAKEAGVTGTLTNGNLVNLAQGSTTTTATTANVANSIAAGPYGANGLANGLEATTESGVTTYPSTYLNYALNSTINACLDTDSDGKPDVFDIDDDNDGVLDVVEQAGCVFTGKDVTTIPFSGTAVTSRTASTITSSNTGNWLSSYSNENFALPISLKFKRPVSGNTAMIGLVPSTAALTPNSWADTGYKFYFLGADVNGYFGASWNFTQATSPSNEYSIDISATGFVTVRINGVQVRAFQGANTTYKLAVSGMSTMQFTEVRLTNMANPEIMTCPDMDNDGRPNYLDLDSDGDGCSDAIEAGSSTSATSTSVFPTGTDANNNGLLNDYEGNTAGTINYTSTYTNFATNQHINACTNSDGDGARDVFDLDDDNDGILDTTEQTNCISSGLDLTTLTFNGSAITARTASTITGAGGGVWRSSYSDQNLRLPISLKFKRNPTGVEMFGLIPAAAAQITANWNDSGYKFYPSYTNLYGYFTTAWDFGPVPITANDVLSIDISSTGFVTAAVNGVTQRAFQGTVSDYKLVLSSNIASSLTDIVLTDANNLAVLTCTDIDTDGDGIPNRLDLDSDGDGCADAREADVRGTLTTGTVINRPVGATINTTTAGVANAIATGPYGNNGFADGLEATAENGVYNGTYNYTIATSNTLNGCLDTDSDGVGDLIDLDDDNDGVLDVTELACADQLTSKTGVIVSRPSTINYSFNGNTLANLVDGVDANVYVAHSPTGTLTNSPLLIFEFPTPRALSYLEIGHYQGQTLFSTTSTYKIQGSTNNTTWTDVTGTLTYTNASTSTSGGLSNHNSNIARFPTNTTAYKFYRIFAISATTGGGWATEIYFRENVCSWDIDNDGIINSLDLDSDGDGCADAVEAGSSNTARSTVTFPSGTDSNSNGLLDNYEVGTTGTINYTATYADFALDNSINVCTDTDGDGKSDFVDIDDDNDGVLDTEEYNCSPSPMNKTGVTVSSTVTWGYNSTTLAQLVNNVEELVAYSNSEFLNQTILQFNLPAARVLSAIEIGTGGGGTRLPLGTTGTYKVQGWNGTSWTDLTGNQTFGTPTAPINAANNSYKINFATNYTAYTRYRIFGTSNRGTVSDWIQEAYFTERTCILDLDRDGTPNHLDLDSDGDGCADAIEAGSSTSATSTSAYPTGTDTNGNGFLNNYESNTTAGTINYTSTYTSFALTNTINACTDTDSDGVRDVLDLDDDNDGILDSIECPLTQLNTNESNGTFGTGAVPRDLVNTSVTGGYVYTTSNTGAGQYAVINQSTAFFPNSTSFWRYPGHTTGTATDAYLAVNGSTTVGTFYRESVTLQAGARYRISFWHQAASANNAYQLAAEILSSSNVVLATANTGAQNSLGWKLTTVDYTSTSNQTVTFILKNVSINANGNDFSIDDISFTAIGCPDSDGDGIPNQLDLDSDNDGCSDANEAYGSGTAQGTDGNQQFGTNPITVDATGKVTGASYTASSVNVLTVGRASVITAQPADFTSVPGATNVSYSATVTAGSGTTAYQWQLSTNGGASWANITNNATYSGATTATLTLSTVTIAMKEYRYRLTITQSDFVCGNLTSSAARLIMNNTPVVTDDLATAVEDTPLNGSVLTNDSGSGGSTLTVTNFTINGTTYNAGQTANIPNVGTFILRADGTYTFSPATNYTGAVPVISYTATDANGGSDTGDLQISITPVNDPVVVVNETVSTNQGVVATGSVLANDTDADGNTLAVTQFTVSGVAYNVGEVVSIPGKGTITVAANGTYTFTPVASYSGSVPVIGYTVSDGNGSSVNGTLTLTVIDVNDPPVAADDLKSTLQNTPVSGNVLTNDSDPESNSLSITKITIAGVDYAAGTTHTILNVGTILVNADGTYTFTPTSTFTGAAPVITYTVSDGTASSTAALKIAVTPVVNTNPVAVADTKTTTEGTPATGNVLTNDTDAEGSSLSVTSFTISGVTYPVGTTATISGVGTVVVNSNGTYTFTPLATYAGTVPVISYAISDGNSGIASSTLTISITAVNDAPLAVDDVASVTEDTPKTGNVISNDSDIEGHSLSVTEFIINGTTYPAGQTATLSGVGTLIINTNGSYTFTPAPNYSGSVPVANYTITDGNGGTDTADLTLTMVAVNDAPVASDDAASTPQGTVKTGDIVTGDDTDADGNTLTLTQFKINGVTYPAGSTATISGVGTLQINADGTYTFTPIPAYVGTVPTVEYTLSDGNGGTDTGNFVLTVTNVNDAPEAGNDEITVLQGVTATGSLVTNDTDQDSDALSISAFTIAGQSGPFVIGTPYSITGTGTYTLNATGSYTFVPDASFRGTAPVVTYTLSDGNGGADTATLTIYVSPVDQPPVATDDTGTANEDNPVTGDILSNDTDPDNGTVLSVTQFAVGGLTYPAGSTASIPNVGTLVVNANGTYTFTPLPNYNGTVPTISYLVTDTAGYTDSGDLVIAITAVNDAPLAVNDAKSGTEDAAITGNVKSNDTDPEGSTLSITQFTIGSTNYPAGTTATIANVGDLVVNADGSYTFTPVANYNGTVPVVTYTLSDGAATSTATLSLSITAVNDLPVASNDTDTTPQGSAKSGDILTVGDTDADGNNLTLTQFTIGGVTYPAGTTATIPGVGTLVINTDGTYTFTPNATYVGTVPTVTYTISDGQGGTATGTFILTVTNVPEPPVATDDAVTVGKNTVVNGNLVSNDSDPEANTLTIASYSINGVTGPFTLGTTVTIPNVGTMRVNADGTYVFTPLPIYSGSVPVLTYTVSDGNGGTDTGTLSITVIDTNTPPIATNDPISATEDTPSTGNVLTNDSDPNSDALSVASFVVGTTTYPAGASATIPNVGTITMAANGAFTFTPFANYNGTVPAINYTITDGLGGVTTAALTITVAAVNDDPIAVNDDNISGPEDSPITGNVLANDSDPDGTPITVSQFSIAGVSGVFTAGQTANISGKGSLQINADGTFTFTPLPNYFGAVPVITYTATDAVGATDTATLNLTVTPVNDLPVVVGETPSTPENTALSGNVLTDGTDDSDVDGNTLSISQFTISGTTYPAGSIVNLPNVGSVIVNADGTYTFTPVTGYFGTPPVITYTVGDANGGTTNGTLAITVTPVNDPPVVTSESIQIQEDAPATGNLLTNDTDPENNTLSISQFTIAGVSGTFTPGTTVVTIPNVGTIQISANGAYTFTPVANYNGIVPNIEYTVSDGLGGTTPGNLTIVVAAVNDAPTVTNDTKSEPVNTPIVGNVLSNDRDIEGSSLGLTKFTIGGVDYPAGTTATIVGVGTVVMNADGTYTFTPAINYVGSPPVITYTVSDGTTTSTGTLSLTITPIDADGDGIPDATEKGTGSTPRDSDNDTIPDYLDTDSDNDGIPDAAEDSVCIGFLPCTPTDTDGDGTPDYRDLDSDGDGISDAIEGTTDTDGDGIPNYRDSDSDGDGILDSEEKGPTATPVDTDLDGTPDYRDLDSDGDGIPDATEGALDTDGDNIPNFRDLDSDADGISDEIEGSTDTDGDNLPNYLDTDSDGDGISDTIEKGPTGTPVDTDGDGTPDYKDLDSDNDGILDSEETATDTDSDGIPNFRDLDSDRDGILDAVEGTTDSDGDGTPNYRDVDSDGDGIPDSIEKGTGSVPADTDGDGSPDYLDLDSDGDGIPDAVEDAGCTGTAPCTPTDTDGDGTPNFRDLDSDGDGLTDAVEKGANGASPVDTDGDTTPDYLDVDSDGDGISDAIEKGTGTTPLDTDGDGIPDYRDTDSDNDGILDSVEKGTGTSPVDTDNDGTPDYRDLDSDADGKSDQSEGTVDTDNDGTPNYLDLDSDEDGVLDAVDVCPLINGLGSTNGCPPDSDGDGLADVDDSDDDNDGILDTVEAAACSPATATCDTDGDGIPNILDTDSDGDGISDVIEAGGTDVDRDGKADGAVDGNGVPASAAAGLTPPNTDGTGSSNPYDTDSDGDGILDAIEKGTGVTLADTDNDTIPDYLDIDSDGDGISDAIEKGTGTAVADTDNDGIPDYRDLDSDGDDIPDSIEKGSGSTPVDTDGDGIPNFRDVDSDGDGILDSVEDAGCTGIAPCTPTNSDNDSIPDYLDQDSDNDGIPDAIEGTVDTDTDGTPDYLDTDSDGDGILDSVENAGCTGTMPCTPTDTDGDGIPNFRDQDSDGDGILDAIEGTTNTDGDLLPNYLDPDSDGDGISDLIEGNVDSDGDGTPNYKDLDSDGDGIPDAIEKGTTTAPVDTDSDGTPDYLDTDTDGDGIPDSAEDYGCTGTAPCTPTDTDGDGIPNHKDLDSDNDGIPDSVEKGATGANPDDTDGTGLPNYLDTDSDDDGILDAVERGIDGNNPLDTDGDGTPDYKEVESDGDGITDAIEGTVDTDGDGIPNYRDIDSDNDGILDATEGTLDPDGDTIPNYKDLDSDGDNKSDQSEGISDFDGDTTPNYLDTDSDGDGVLDNVDQCPLLFGLANLNGCPVDTDGDGVYDVDDADDDNDGLLDTVEAAACSPSAADCDTDGDGIPNRLDPDSDNDGISDVRESNGTDVDGDGKVDGTVDVNGVPSSTNGGLTPPNTDSTTLPDPFDTDSDGDGISDSLERGPNPNAPVDTDGDGTPDYRDLDSDGDGIPDSVERGTGAAILDTDGDGTPDYKDLDSDNDGIQDTVEKGPNGATPLDTDGDGIPNYRDLDSDGDSIPDSIEKGTGSTLLNSDGDTLPDYLDTDSDGDGISDAIEKGLNGNSPIDTDGDGTPDYRDTDSDNDGIPDSVEKGTGTTPIDTDGDGVPNYRDLDSDGDGITDAVEKGANGATPVDTDGDGSPDYLDLDADGDGKLDAIEKGTGVTLLDTDRDGIPDYRDVDNYGQPDVNVTDVNVPVVGNVKTNDAVPAGTTYGQPAAIAGATFVTNPATGTYTFTSATPGTYEYLIPVCGPNQTTNCPLTPLQITVLDPLAVDKPVANTDFAILEQGGSATVAILANDKAGDLGKTIDAASLVVLTAPAHGTALVNSDGTITYTPSPFFVGVDSLEYRVCDTNNPAQCQTATVYFTVEPAGLVVKTGAVDDFAIVRASPDGSANVTGNVLSNDLNGTGATLTANLVTGPTSAQGTFTLNANGTYSFTPAAGFSGPVDIVYEACGGSPVVCTKATLHILVEPLPTLVNDTNTAFANVPKAGNLATNDTNPAGTTYGQPAQQAGATLTVNPDGTYSITATTAGTYTYTIPVCAPGQVGTCPTQTLVVTVTAPTLGNDTNTALANVPKTGNLSTNDTNPAGSTYGQPVAIAGATIVVNADGTYSFTATAAGTYTYTVPVCAPGQTVNCPTQTLEITVTAPSLVNDTNTALANVPKTGNLSTNDTNPAGSTYGQPAQQAGATLTVNADGTYSFTATAAGTYTYTIPVCALGQTVNCPTQTLTITVTAPSLVNDTNTALAYVPKAGNLSTNDRNPDSTTYGQPAQQAGATLTVNADGTYSFTATAAGTYTYTIPVCAPGQTVSCPTQTLTITVTAPSLVNDTNTAFANVPKTGNLATNDTNPAGSTYGQPAQQTGATLTVNADGTYSFTATAAGTYTYTIPVCSPGQTVNCPTQTLTITVTAPSLVNDTNTALANVPKTGNLSTNDTNPAGSTYGQPVAIAGATIVVNADGTYSFTATAEGTYTYTIPVCAPGQTANCPTETLTITVTAPSLVNDSDTALANLPKAGNLSTNDTNPAGSTYGQPAQQAGATLTVNADGTYSFTATAAGTYTYTIPVCAPGQTVNCPTQTLTITVTAPSLVNDTNTALANVPKAGNLATNDTNPAGSTYGQPAQQAGATLTVNANGTYSFTATAAGTYTYTIPVCAPGQTANCPTQTLEITVTAPSLVNDTNTALANVPKTGNLSTNDRNPDGTTYGQPAQQAGATLTVNADGTYSFTATAAGTYTYTIPVCAPGQTANCPTQTLTITVTAPSLVNDTDTALANVPKTGNLSTNDTNPAGSTYGQPAQQAGATITVNADGTYSFTATAAGTYTYTVPVCAPGQTANCPTQTLEIKVTGNDLVAGLDNFQSNQINGLTGGIAGNVLANDALDGKPIVAAQVVITVKNNGGLTGVVIDKEGNLILPAGVAPGSYVVVYTICDVLDPTNCREAMVMVEVFLPVDLKVTKSVEAPEWFEGDEFTYTLRVENTGKTPATSVVVTDMLPVGLRYVSLVSSQIPVTTQVRGQEINFNITQLPIAGSTDITLKVKAAPLADGKDISLLNTVSVTSKGREMSPADNTSSVPVLLKAFFIPNTITPNGGGINDTFEIPGLGRYVSNELVIVNRWGDQVFERKNYQNDWGAEGLVSGTYFYILKVTDEDGKEASFKGFVEVVKERIR